MAAREVVTLQIGSYSNFVGTHWWNLQESSFVYDPQQLATFPKEVNHDILFREGKTVTGQVTYTPRLVLFDLNHSLGSLKREGTLYTVDAEESVNWIGDVTLHETPKEKRNLFLEDLEETKENSDDADEIKASDLDENAEKSEEAAGGVQVRQVDPVFGKSLYNLDNEVKVWSDYLRTALHPRTIHILQDYQFNNAEQPFNVFGMGQQVVGGKTLWDQVEDRVRFFTEECDHLQGFQIFLDCHDGFGGVGASVLSYLTDEYSSKSRFTFAVTPTNLPDKTAKDRSCRIINSALSVHSGCELSSLYLPLSLSSTLWKSVGDHVTMPYLEYKADLNYHTSAVLAASIDTLTLPYRKESGASRVADITSSFSSLGRKVACLNSSIPFPLMVGSTFADTLISFGKTDPWTSLTPHVKCAVSPYFQSCVVRGIPESMVKRSDYHGLSRSFLSSCTSVDDVLRLYLAETYPSSMNAGCVMRDGLKVGSPYPHIFSPNVNHKGFVSDTKRTALSGVYSVPATTSLQSSSDIYSYIASLQECVSQFKISRHTHFLEAGMEEDDYAEMVEGLLTLAQCYETEGD
ncbi:misato-like protein 1 [Plakobranchus ocellatus]|uniref:Misato-like protein 1 n=1 Tax=Plakobranchus ocellatus TaxID=259542 RepID=A0AAV3YC79_9GAST|nr:misato-like protein 1 [Plakobranchus ocellatus]